MEGYSFIDKEAWPTNKLADRVIELSNLLEIQGNEARTKRLKHELAHASFEFDSRVSSERVGSLSQPTND